jgi:hypothetical protein
LLSSLLAPSLGVEPLVRINSDHDLGHTQPSISHRLEEHEEGSATSSVADPSRATPRTRCLAGGEPFAATLSTSSGQPDREPTRQTPRPKGWPTPGLGEIQTSSPDRAWAAREAAGTERPRSRSADLYRLSRRANDEDRTRAVRGVAAACWLAPPPPRRSARLAPHESRRRPRACPRG